MGVGSQRERHGEGAPWVSPEASFTLGADGVIFLDISFTFDIDYTFSVHEVPAVKNGPGQFLMLSVNSTDDIMKAHIEMLCTKVKLQLM